LTSLDFIKLKKLPLALIERGAKLPNKSLSAIIHGKRKMPLKHEKRVCEFLVGYGFESPVTAI